MADGATATLMNTININIKITELPAAHLILDVIQYDTFTMHLFLLH